MRRTAPVAPMHSTHPSLLDRLRASADADAWGRFVRLYTPLLFHWCRRLGVADPDAPDVVQDVLLVVFRDLPGFQYDPGRSFRGWLFGVTRNKARDKARKLTPIPAGAGLDAEPDPTPDPSDRLAEADEARHLAARALALMRDRFEPATWRACWEQVVNDRPAAEVAAELGVTVNAAYLARSRVLRLLRQELAGLV